MSHRPVESSTIASYDYNPLTHQMEVRFKNGSLYRYSDVDQDTVKAFEEAESKGGFLHQRIRGVFPFEKGER